MSSIRIPYTKPSITDLEISYANDAVTNGWGAKCYEYIERFENQFKAHLGVKFAIATSSCTGALHMGLHALGIGPGDEVIMGDINWIATASPIVHLGASPVFVDILSSTWCLDPAEVEKAITPRTKAIIAVHLYGSLCDMSSLLDISRKYNVPIIEDSAEAIGSIYHDSRAGSLGEFGVFSFHGTKTITTGEGGMFVTNNESLYNEVLTLSNHGRRKGDPRQFWSDIVGFKYKLSNIQAAIGCAQLERISSLIDEKRSIFSKYKSLLSHLPLLLNQELPGTYNSYWMPTLVSDVGIPFERETLSSNFSQSGVDARVFFWPLSLMSIPNFRKSGPNIISDSTYRRALNLPSYFGMTDAEIEYVSNIVIDYFGSL